MDFSTTMAMIGDNDPTEFQIGTVSAADRKRIDGALNMVFEGLTLLRWLDGGRLADAWRDALDKMRMIGYDIQVTSPIVLYLRQANFDFRRKWESKVVQSRIADNRVQCPADQINQWRDQGNAQVRDGMETIRQLVTKSVPAIHTKKSLHPAIAREQQNMRERKNERERENERTRGK